MMPAQGTVGGGSSGGGSTWLSATAWRRRMREQPLIPLLLLLGLLIVLLQVAQPGIINQTWATSTIRFSIALAMLAACQTLTMLTGGIDLSVGAVASMTCFIAATQAPTHGPFVAIALGLAAAMLAGLVTGVGVGIFRVHPLIMTLAMSLVILGVMTIYQVQMVRAGSRVPDAVSWVTSVTSIGPIPNALVWFVPLAALLIWGLGHTGYGRMLYAVGDNEIAARLAGVRVWQVLLTLYVVSALLAALAGVVYSGITVVASITLVDKFVLPSVAAAVIGGTSIFGGRGGYAGSIVGAVILTVLTRLLTVLQMPEAARQVLFGAIILAVAAAYTKITAES
jgi:ribose transport system permease protein